MTATEAERFWEERYRSHERMWSGRANVRLVDVVAPLAPGRALDLGCGEGGDAVWLACRGWNVSAVDVSATALERTAAAAAAAGVEDRVSVEQHDLGRSFPAGTFDLVSAQFLQSPVALPRTEVLRAAAGALAERGLLLIVEHASVPPWASERHRGRRFPTPEQALARLELDLRAWDTECLGSPERQMTGPLGEQATVRDNVIALRRRRGVTARERDENGTRPRPVEQPPRSSGS